MPSGEITISCHERQIPSFVESELELLYQDIHSSLAFFKQFRSLEDVSTYVVRRGTETVALFLFRCDKARLIVLNEMISVDEQEIERFANYVLARYRQIAVICFPAIQTTAGKLTLPCQRSVATEDYGLRLPVSPHAYTMQLGKATREYIKRYHRKILRDFPSFTCRFHRGDDISEQTIRDIIAMSKARMERKKKKFAVNDGEAEALVRLARSCGHVHVASIDGRLCAGALSYRAGAGHSVFIIAHDPEFDPYRMGTVLYYLTICEIILRHGNHFHMGRGAYDYKERLLGVRNEYHRLIIYRSYRHMALHCGIAAKSACGGMIQRLKYWMLDPRRQRRLITRAAMQSLYLLRSMRRNK